MTTTLSAGLAAAGRATPRPTIRTRARVRPRYELRDMAILLSEGSPEPPWLRARGSTQASEVPAARSKNSGTACRDHHHKPKNKLPIERIAWPRSPTWEVQPLGQSVNFRA